MDEKIIIKRNEKGQFLKGGPGPRKGIKGLTPWNKNLTKEIDERVLNISKKSKITQFKKGMIPWNKNIKGKYHYQKNRGISNGYINSSGYLVFYRFGREILAHREIWEKYHGKIPNGFLIHHRDNNRLNNDISNLMLITRREHSIIHWEEIKCKMTGRKKKNG
jgi:hypothetical protein